MYTMRLAQVTTFSSYMLRNFENRMIEEFRTSFAKRFGELGEGRVRSMIHQGLADGKKYGVVNEGEVVRYLRCMMILGPDFDRDPKLPWAATILRQVGVGSPEKMDSIEDHVIFETREE